MQDILQNFGIEPVLLLAQVVNFLIIFWLLKKFAYKPIFAMLEKRKKLIAEGVENAQKSQDLLQKSLEEEKALLKKAQGNVTEILTDAQKQAQDIVAVAEEGAKKRVEKILEDAKKEIEDQTLLAEKQLSKHTAELAAKLLEKSLSSLVDSKTQKEIVAKAMKKLS
jgi:F-type H+-transporting ATPase subunit b